MVPYSTIRGIASVREFGGKSSELVSVECDTVFHRSITVDHIIDLDGCDQGSGEIDIGPSGDIAAVRAAAGAEAGRRGGVGEEGVELSAIPLLGDSHMHLGISDGVNEQVNFHALDLVDVQLRHLAVSGVGHVHSLGTDQVWLQRRLRERLASGDAGEKAFGYSAGIGFGAVDGWPPELTAPEVRFRPVEAGVARGQVRKLADLGCRTLKVWVDDFGGTVPKIPTPVIRAIFDEARQCGITTFAHVFFHEDAEVLVSLGVDVLAHSVRDKTMSAALIDLMLRKGTTLVPTLSREEAELAFSLKVNPYLSHEFFLTCERDQIGRLRGARFSDDPDTPKQRLEIGLENVARAYAAGVPIGLGTDSGFKMKLLGFAQHRELELLSQAGMRPTDCLKAALEISQRLFATGLSAIKPGVPASFFVVEGDPGVDVRATQHVREVWVCGKRLSGPDTAA